MWKGVEGLGQAFSGLSVRNAADPNLPQDALPPNALLAGDQPRGGVADDGGLQLRLVDPRGAEGPVNGLPGQVLHAAVEELPELRHARADDSDVPHGVLLGRMVLAACLDGCVS